MAGTASTTATTSSGERPVPHGSRRVLEHDGQSGSCRDGSVEPRLLLRIAAEPVRGHDHGGACPRATAFLRTGGGAERIGVARPDDERNAAGEVPAQSGHEVGALLGLQGFDLARHAGEDETVHAAGEGEIHEPQEGCGIGRTVAGERRRHDGEHAGQFRHFTDPAAHSRETALISRILR
jgi:hypothetical protein